MKYQPFTMPSNYILNNILPSVDIPRSTFNLTETHKTTFNSGYLIPIYWNEIYPGDTFDFSIQALARLATPIAPIMDNASIKYYSFFVPNRLLWENWKAFMGEQENPDDVTDFEIPQISSGSGADWLSLSDYLGIPPKVPNLKVSSLVYRAYNLIWNEWFRDENLQDSVTVKKDDALEQMSDYVLLKKCKPADYFTTCLPWLQKGEAVTIPLTGDAPVMGTHNKAAILPVFNFQSQTVTNNTINRYDGPPGVDTPLWPGIATQDPVFNTNLYADLSNVTSATINDLRMAFQIQRYLEKDARGGTRYVEYIKNHFGVDARDYRLQRPEYLGGGQTDITITPVAQTSATDKTTPQGNLSAVGTAGTIGNGYVYSATEHGIIITLACLCADINYQQGLNRKWSKKIKYDYMVPSFWYLGEQAVLNKEIYAQGTSEDDEVFGYQQRYRELREGFNNITGLFRSTHPQSLDIWHLAQEFSNLPKLNEEFITENSPFKRIMAVQTEPDIIADFRFNIKATRPLPSYVEPGLIDHF